MYLLFWNKALRSWRFGAPKFRGNVVVSSLRSRNMSKKNVSDTFDATLLHCLKYMGTRHPGTQIRIPKQLISYPYRDKQLKSPATKCVYITEYVIESWT